ncbi:MAG TPA: chemotaxis protein CheW [Patescibacteria group bacterium]|nr:chemotaxis protein CheW [Patescibacteria group bacterium]
MAKVTTIGDTQQILAVYLGTEMFGVPISRVQGVLETLPLTFVPLAPPAVRGVMNLRGRIVTAIDLRSAITESERNAIPSRGDMSVVFEDQGELFSLLVDTVGDVHTVPSAGIEPPPPTMAPALQRVSAGVYAMKQKIMIILKPSALLHTGDAA